MTVTGDIKQDYGRCRTSDWKTDLGADLTEDGREQVGKAENADLRHKLPTGSLGRQ